MALTLTTQQGQRLTTITVALRPDWLPNNPGKLWHDTNQTGWEHATDYDHILRALVHYALQRDNTGRYTKRTPNLFPEDGAHWTTTTPPGSHRPPAAPCADHPEFDAHNCRCCWSEIKTRQRPHHLLGKHHPADPTEGEPPTPRVAATTNHQSPPAEPADSPQEARK